MAKVQINIEKLTPLGGIVPNMEQFVVLLTLVSAKND